MGFLAAHSLLRSMHQFLPVLAIWNQISPEEIYSWANSWNQESLNDAACIPPPPFRVYDMIVYDYGMGTVKGHGTRLRVLPLDWLYE